MVLSDNKALKFSLAKWMLFSGVLMMVVGCFWGLIPSTESAIKNKKAFVGTHHQFAHNAEMLMAMAFGYPFLNLGAVGLYSSFILLQLGTWLNPIAYVMRTLTGNESEVQTFTDGPIDGPWSGIITATFMACGVTVLLGQFIYMWGVARAVNIYAQDAIKTKTK